MGVNGNSSNYTNASPAPSPAPGFPTYLDEPLAATVFQITLWSTIAFLGVIGNLLVCLVIVRRLRKTSMNYYLLSLAIADLGVLLIIYPVAVCKYLKPFKWLLGERACLYMFPTEEIFFGASIWSITAIAIERYRNIVGAKRYQFWKRSGLKTAFRIFAVWLASFLVSSVPLYPVMKYEPTIPLCIHTWSDRYRDIYSITLIIVWYVFPLAVITFTYVKIKERVRDSIAFRDSMTVNDGLDYTKMSQSALTRRTSGGRIWRQSKKTQRILTPLVILFAVTMFPLNALRLAVFIDGNIPRNKYYKLAVGLIGMFVIINSSVNPLVYYITSKEFKEAFKSTLKGLRKRNPKNLINKFSRFARSLSRRSFASSPASHSTRSAVVTAEDEMFRNVTNRNASCQIGDSRGDVQFESGL